jgi:uncharacterized membrane protein
VSDALATARPGDRRPPGWSYNPSAWHERRFVVIAAAAGLAIALYLTLFQLGVVGEVFDPLFGPAASRAVLHSALAQRLPFPDAAAGAVAYVIEIVTAAVGGDDRWRTRGWLVLLYAATTLGLGLASTVLVMLQPLLARAWCTLCLLSALISVNLVGPALAEALATLQDARRAATRGVPFSRALLGETPWRRAA